MANLFKKAATASTVKVSKSKEKKLRASLSDDYFDKIKRLQELNTRLKQDGAEADLISDEIKEIAREKWCSIYEKTGKNPGSIMLEVKSELDTAQCMFLAQDKYLKITPEMAEDLKNKYGEDIVEETNTFGFDSEMIEKYGDVLSDLIENCTSIRSADKEKIITSTKSITIKKGVIDNFKKIADDYNEPLISILEQVRPIVALKNLEVING
jgi:hypothetical protein